MKKKKCILFIITQHNFFFSIFYFFKKSSNVIVCHEFCMNAFDHVFGKILGKMQLTVKLEGGVLGKMGSSKTIYYLGNFFSLNYRTPNGCRTHRIIWEIFSP